MATRLSKEINRLRHYGRRIGPAGPPLQVARAALDLVALEQMLAAKQAVSEGADLWEFVTRPIADPLVKMARTMLSVHRPNPSDYTAGTSWVEWFHLKALVETLPHRAYIGRTYDGAQSQSAVRMSLSRLAYRGYGGLLPEILDIQRSSRVPDERRDVAGILSEIGLLAAFNYNADGSCGARMSSAPADNRGKTDVRYWTDTYIPHADSLQVTSVQVKNRRDNRPAGATEQPPIPQSVVMLYASDVMPVGADPYGIQRLIEADVQSQATDDQQLLLGQRAALAHKLVRDGLAAPAS